MNAVHCAMLGLVMATGGWACFAQDAAIPFRQIERNAQLTPKVAGPADEAAVRRTFEIPLRASSSTSITRLPATPVPPRVFTRGFFLLNGLHLAMAVVDVEATQHCIAEHQCREGNPLMPSSQAGQFSVDFALVGYGSFISYRLKEHGSHFWWIVPAMGIAAHGAGVATGFAHQ